LKSLQLYSTVLIYWSTLYTASVWFVSKNTCIISIISFCMHICQWWLLTRLSIENKMSTHVHRGASRGFVRLSWQAPLYHRYSAWKPIKYKTLSLQVSNASVLEQATAFPVALYYHETMHLLCLNSKATAQWHETIHVLNTLPQGPLWQSRFERRATYSHGNRSKSVVKVASLI